jgi:uncharacterized membrane protein
MERFWERFWKLFGLVSLAMLIVAVALGIISHSSKITYTLVQGTFAAVFGLIGIIAFIVVPVELYLEDTRQKKNNHSVSTEL